MSKFKKALVFSACILLLAGCGDKKDEAQGAQRGPQGPLPVTVFEAFPADEPITLSYPARVTSEQDVIIVAKVTGTLEKQNFKPGDSVKEGDELFLIEPAKYEANYEVAKAGVSVANANFERARLNYNRANKLKKSNSVSQQEFDNALAEYKSAQASVESAKASLATAGVDLNYTKVIAPFDGILGDTFQDLGAYVGPQNPNLVRLTKLNPISAKFAIADTDALTISSNIISSEWEQKDANATLIINDKEYQGKVTFIDRVVNKNTGSVDAKAIFDNSKGELLPDSFGVIKMSGFYQKNGFKIPQIAVLQDLSNPFVYVIKDGAAAKAAVKISYQTSEYAIVLEGLNPGDKIILDNFMKLSVGTPVEIVEGK